MIIFYIFVYMNIDSEIKKLNFTLHDINKILIHFDKYFKFYHNGYYWTLNEKIFKIFFLNYDNRIFYPNFKKIIKNKYKTELELKYDFLKFLIETNFIELDDIKN